MKDFVARVQKAHDKLDSECEAAKKELLHKVEFEFNVHYMAGDGPVILNIESDQVAPLRKCLEVIKEKGTLSEDDHDKIGI